MSNLEKNPPELVMADATMPGFELLKPRNVPLGGPRAMEVRRTLPQRARSLIGAWCFVDHYGPDAVARTAGMVVPPHPHTGLQTVSWLFAGEIEHRDSSGAHAMVRPGELNLMTAGRGIQHSEVSTIATTMLHGAQLWVALPDAVRHTTPQFEHFVPTPLDFGGTTVRVFLGALLGSSSPATTYTPLVGAQLDIPAGATALLPVDSTFEHGVLVDSGTLWLDGRDVPVAHLAYLAPGRSELILEAGEVPVRALLIGGAPLGERIVMWWNFIGRSHEEITDFRQHWQTEVIAAQTDDGQFGHVDGFDGIPLPAPELPNVRLRPRQ